MGRVLFWVGLAVLIYAAIVVARIQRVRRSEQLKQERKTASEPIKFLTCPVCGVRFARSEAVQGGDKAYCSEKCRAQARQDGTAR